jgi:hypothetical protein
VSFISAESTIFSTSLTPKLLLRKSLRLLSLNKNIKSLGIVNISNNLIRNADITISTGENIALNMLKLNSSKGVKYLRVQKEENFAVDSKQLNIFRLPVHNIVTDESTRDLISLYTNKIPDIVTSVGALEDLINSKLSYLQRLETVGKEIFSSNNSKS